jgi:hypothetical protein
MNSRLAAATNAARVLTVAGVILILSFLVDFLILLFPFQPTNKEWLIGLTTALVDRGIVPLVGLGMLFAGYWFDTLEDGARPAIDLRLPAFILSSILGLMFLLIFPLHLNNIIQDSNQKLERIDKEAEQLENQLKSQLQQLSSNDQYKVLLEKQRQQLKAQYTEALKNEDEYNKILANPNIPQSAKDVLKKAKANPQELDKAIAQQTDPQTRADQQISQIRQKKEDAEKQAKELASKSGLRNGIGSLLLAIGYITIGWRGLRSMGAFQGGGRKAPAR